MCKKWRRTHDIFRSVCETINVELRVPSVPEQRLLNIFGLDAATDDEISLRSLTIRRVPCYPRFPILFPAIMATMIFAVVSTFVVPLPSCCESYTMLTVNADDHPIMSRMHKPDPKLQPDQQDKRSIVAIEQGALEQWLHGNVNEATELLVPPTVDLIERAPA